MTGTIANAFQKLLGGDNTEVVNQERPQEIRAVGKIIKVSENGWGFISSRDIKFTRIFFHWTSLRQDTKKFTDLRNGDRVEFTPVEIEGKGTRAIKIRVINPEEVVTEDRDSVTE